MKDKHNPMLVRNPHEETAQIKKDLAWVLVLNGIFFAALIALFFFNQATGKVDQFFAQLLKF
jgi:hypothetical protein